MTSEVRNITAINECSEGEDPSHYYQTDLARTPRDMSEREALAWYAGVTGRVFQAVDHPVRGGVLAVREVQA